MSQILTRESFENAIRALAAIGGSTNAVIHLIALAGRIGVPLDLDDFDKIGSHVSNILDIQPSGKHLMEDFYYAGGLPVVLRALAEQGPAQQGRAHRERADHRRERRRRRELGQERSSRPMTSRFKAAAGIAVLRGNLCPDGAVIKPSAASPHLMKHRGRAVVFETIEEFHAKIDDDALDIDENCDHGAEELRSQGLSGHGRGRQHAAAAQAAEEGHHRHGAHLRRAHVRHRLRHRGAARRARKPRPAGRWRWSRPATSSSSTSRRASCNSRSTRVGRAPRQVEGAQAPAAARL